MLVCAIRFAHHLHSFTCNVNLPCGSVNFVRVGPPFLVHELDWLPGADLVNWGPQANIGMGPYKFAHIYQINLEFPFCRDACCCSMVPHSYRISHVHLHLFI